jgi:hypothetical protein
MLGIDALGALALGDVPAGTPETSLPSKWHAPLSEPVRQRIAPTLAVALIASGATVPPIAPFPETVTESRWHQPWSEPVVKSRPRLAEAHQQFLAWQPAPSPFVATGWFNWLAEPVRTRPALPAGHRPFLAPDPLPRVSFGWWAALSEPVRVRPALPAPEQHVFAFDPVPFVKIDWFAPFSEPARVRPAVLVPAPEQQFQPFDEDIIFLDRWFAWWSDPVRIKPALGAGSQQVLAFDPQPFPFLGGGGGWYLPDPTRRPGSSDPSERAVTPVFDGLRSAVRDGSPENEPARPKVRKPGAPRKITPAATPPTFADTIGAQQPARLVDVLGSAFVPQIGQPQSPAVDLYVPPARPAPVVRSIAPPIIDAAADHVDALDAMEALHALDVLEQQERAALIVALFATSSPSS